MYKLLEKLGQNPQASLRLFLRGLGLFCVALAFIALGYFHHHLWQVAGIVTLVIACLIAAWGYTGMFANRWLNIIYRNQAKTKNSTKW
ncbi:hypothetical protein GCM10009111_19630 [Colwellia asteriadis]|uniref:Uncharacterized protein n=1 Tax=Colwellia asteriadis TaxID=517723 RepID=A0ABP3WGN4_9GAMM